MRCLEYKTEWALTTLPHYLPVSISFYCQSSNILQNKMSSQCSSGCCWKHLLFSAAYDPLPCSRPLCWTSLQGCLPRKVTMSNAANLLLLSLVPIMSYLEMVLLELVQKNDSRISCLAVLRCLSYKTTMLKWPHTWLPPFSALQLQLIFHLHPHIHWTLCQGGSPCYLGRKWHLFLPASTHHTVTYLSWVKEAPPFFSFS